MLRVQRYVRSEGKKVFVICSATTLALLFLLLSACGSNVGGQGQATTTTNTLSLQEKECGTVHTLHSQIVPADLNTAWQAENCFWHAFQQCQPATLTYSKSEVDAGSVNTFTLKSAGGKCAVSDGVQRFIVPRPPGKTTSYPCSDVKLQSDGLYVFSCGEVGTIIVPRPI
jgi:hypothetical protein